MGKAASDLRNRCESLKLPLLGSYTLPGCKTDWTTVSLECLTLKKESCTNYLTCMWGRGNGALAWWSRCSPTVSYCCLCLGDILLHRLCWWLTLNRALPCCVSTYEDLGSTTSTRKQRKPKRPPVWLGGMQSRVPIRLQQ